MSIKIDFHNSTLDIVPYLIREINRTFPEYRQNYQNQHKTWQVETCLEILNKNLLLWDGSKNCSIFHFVCWWCITHRTNTCTMITRSCIEVSKTCLKSISNLSAESNLGRLKTTLCNSILTGSRTEHSRSRYKLTNFLTSSKKFSGNLQRALYWLNKRKKYTNSKT